MRARDEEFEQACEERTLIFWLAWNHFDHKASESRIAAIARVDAGLPAAISTTAGSTIPIRRDAGVPAGRGRKLRYEWLILVDIPTGPSISCIGSFADDGLHMPQY
jgi:hypothetical protein